MKHKAIILASVAVAALLTVASVKAYHNQQWQNHVKAVAHSIQVKAQQRAAEVKAAQQKAELDKLKAQCATDHAAYLALTPLQKTKATAPDCNPNLQVVQ